MPLTISIQGVTSPLFLFPARMDDPSSTTVRGEVHAEVDTATEIGQLIIVWQASIEQRQGDTWVNRNVVRTWLGKSADPGPILLPGLTVIPFEILIGAATAASRTTPLDRTVHTIFASILDPAPSFDTAPHSATASNDESHQTSDPTRKSFMRRFRDGRNSPRRSASPGPSGTSSSNSGAKSWSVDRLFKPRHHDWDTPIVEDDSEGSASLPPVCLPSQAYCRHTLDVFTCYDNRWALDRLQILDWVSEQLVPGLGYLKIAAYSDLLVAGSGFNVAIDLQEIGPSISIHSIKIVLLQRTASADEQVSETVEFTLYQLGPPYLSESTPALDDFIWRPDKRLETLNASQSNVRPGSAAKQMTHQRYASTDNSLRLAAFCRMPSPAIGALARWGFYPGITSNTTHYLRVEVYHGILSRNHLGDQTTMSRYRVDHHVGLNDCIASPINIKVPPYNAEPETIDAIGENGTTEQETSAFNMPRDTTRTEDGQTSCVSVAHRQSLTELMRTHNVTTGGSCMCFCSDEDVAKIVGKLEIAEAANELQSDLAYTDKNTAG